MDRYERNGLMREEWKFESQPASQPATRTRGFHLYHGSGRGRRGLGLGLVCPNSVGRLSMTVGATAFADMPWSGNGILTGCWTLERRSRLTAYEWHCITVNWTRTRFFTQFFFSPWNVCKSMRIPKYELQRRHSVKKGPIYCDFEEGKRARASLGQRWGALLKYRNLSVGNKISLVPKIYFYYKKLFTTVAHIVGSILKFFYSQLPIIMTFTVAVYYNFYKDVDKNCRWSRCAFFNAITPNDGHLSQLQPPTVISLLLLPP